MKLEIRIHAKSQAGVHQARRLLEFIEGMSLVPRDIFMRYFANDNSILQVKITTE